MVGKAHMVKLGGGIALVASLAVIVAPSALGAVPVSRPTGSTVGPGTASIYDTRSDLTNTSADVAQAIQASGFAETAAPSAHFSIGGAFNWGDAGIGLGVGAGLMLFLLRGARPRAYARSVPAA